MKILNTLILLIVLKDHALWAPIRNTSPIKTVRWADKDFIEKVKTEIMIGLFQMAKLCLLIQHLFSLYLTWNLIEDTIPITKTFPCNIQRFFEL